MKKPAGEQSEFLLSEVEYAPYSKTVLRYPGGKSKAVDIIREYFPTGLTELVSPFLGGASVELACAADGIQVYGSDILWPLYNFWVQLLEHPQEVRDRAIKYFPVSKQEYFDMEDGLLKLDNPVEQAAVFYLLNRYSFSGMTLRKAYSSDEKLVSYNLIDRLKRFRAPHLSVEWLDFEDALNQRPNCFVYLDPPYELGKGSILYGPDGKLHKEFSHKRLRDALDGRTGWVMSYNGDAEIRKLYEGYRIVDVDWVYCMNKSKTSDEILIISE